MLTIIIQLFSLFITPEVSRLAELIMAKESSVSEDSALNHVFAAKAAETPNVPATLLLSMAYSESRYDPRAVSRVEDGVRKGGIATWKTPPDNVTGPYFCGVTQVAAQMSWKRCVEFRDIYLAYATAAKELGVWFNDPYCRNKSERMRCALFGYGGGYPAIKANSSTYPSRVLSRAKLFEKAGQGNT